MNGPSVPVSEGDDRSPRYFAQQRKRRRSTSTAQAIRELGLMRENGNGKQDAPRFVGSGSGIHFIHSVYSKLSRLSSSRVSTGGHTGDLVPGEDDQLHRHAAVRGRNEDDIWRHDEVLRDDNNDRTAPHHPSFSMLVDWSKPYFDTWHTALPFLNAPEVLEAFEQVEKFGIDSLVDSKKLIVKSVLSISLADGRQGRQVAVPLPASLVFKSIDEALEGIHITLRRPASMMILQAAVCVQLFLLSMLKLNAASRLGGLISRTAFHLGLHRCPARYQVFSQDDAEIRRRLFWSIYCAERFLCQSLGLPLDIRDDDIDVCYPGEELHASPGSNGVIDCQGSKRLQMLTFLAKHARIRGLILELRNKSIHARQDTADHADFVHAELARWVNEVEDSFDADLENDVELPNSLCASHKLLLMLLKSESIISLNRPLMASDHRSPSYAAALQHCIGAARSIIVSLKCHFSKNRCSRAAEDTRLSVPLVWPSCTWSLWISTFVLIFSAFERQLPIKSALRLAEQAKQVLAHIATRDTFWPEYCMSAVDGMASALVEISNASDAVSDLNTARPTSQLSISRNNRPQIAVHSQGGVSPPSSRAGTEVSPRNSSQQLENAGDITRNEDARYGQTPYESQHDAFTGADEAIRIPTDAPTANNGQHHPTFLSTSRAESPHIATQFEDPSRAFWQNQFLQGSFDAIGYPFLAATSLDPATDSMPFFLG